MKIFLFVLGMFITTSVTAQTTQPAKWLTHKDVPYKLTMQYPSNWQLKPPTENARFFVTSYPESDSDDFRENINCIVPKAVQSGLTIQMAEEEISKTLSDKLPDFNMIRAVYLKWNNATAYEIEYTCTQTNDGGTYSLHMLQRVSIIKGKLYALTFTSKDESYSKYISTVMRMINSFKVL